MHDGNGLVGTAARRLTDARVNSGRSAADDPVAAPLYLAPLAVADTDRRSGIVANRHRDRRICRIRRTGHGRQCRACRNRRPEIADVVRRELRASLSFCTRVFLTGGGHRLRHLFSVRSW